MIIDQLNTLILGVVQVKHYFLQWAMYTTSVRKGDTRRASRFIQPNAKWTTEEFNNDFSDFILGGLA